MQKLLLFFYSALAIFALSFTIFPLEKPDFDANVDIQYKKGKIVEVQNLEEEGSSIIFEVDGVNFESIQSPDQFQVLKQFKKGQSIIAIQVDNNPYEIFDHDRSHAILLALALLVVMSLFVLRKKGLLALWSLAIQGILLFKLLIPAILHGFSSLSLILLASALIFPIQFYIHKSSGCAHHHDGHDSCTDAKQDHAPFISSLLSVFLGSGLLYLFSQYAPVLGLGSEEALILSNLDFPVSIPALWITGAILALMGILDDITQTQCSVVRSLYDHSALRGRKLFSEAMKTGEVHAYSVMNTLILVYIGSSLPLFVFSSLSEAPLWVTLSQEKILEEVFRSFIGVLTLLMAIPLSTFFAVLLYAKGHHADQSKTPQKP